MTKSKIFAAVLGGSMLFASAAYAVTCTPTFCEQYPKVCYFMGCGT
ncbi:MAG: hypothetical protein AAFR39_14030 [Pseudomonadota bacterium]